MRDFKSFSVSIDHGRLFGEIEFSGDSRIYGYTTSGKWVHFEPRSKSTIGISEFIDEHWNSAVFMIRKIEDSSPCYNGYYVFAIDSNNCMSAFYYSLSTDSPFKGLDNGYYKVTSDGMFYHGPWKDTSIISHYYLEFLYRKVMRAIAHLANTHDIDGRLDEPPIARVFEEARSLMEGSMIFVYDFISSVDKDGKFVEHYREFSSSGFTLNMAERYPDYTYRHLLLDERKGWIGLQDGDLFYASGAVNDERLEHKYITICSISENPTVSILTLNSNRHSKYADLKGYYCLLNDNPVKISNPEYLSLYGITEEAVASYTNSVLVKYGRHRSRGDKNRFYDSMKGLYETYFGPKSKKKENK